MLQIKRNKRQVCITTLSPQIIGMEMAGPLGYGGLWFDNAVGLVKVIIK